MSRKNNYDDIDLLLNDIRSDIEDVLMDDVLEEVRDIEISNVKRDVLSAYSPKIYNRRSANGIDDRRNIIGEVRDMQLSVDNITEFNDAYGTYNHGVGLADLINDGSGKSGFYYDYSGEFERPRPFIDNTILEVEKTDRVEEALERGMKRKKYDIT